jgi:hypothetical protein
MANWEQHKKNTDRMIWAVETLVQRRNGSVVVAGCVVRM